MTSTLKLGSKIPISEIEGDISEASGMTGFLDDDLTKLSQAGKEAVFNGITVDLSSGVSISNNGAMPFDGWAHLNLSVWQSMVVNQNNRAYVYINDVRVGSVINGYATMGVNNSCDIYIPVKTGDIFKWVGEGPSNSARSCSCTLYPYKNSQEAAE